VWVLHLKLGLHLKVSKRSKWVILKRPCMWILHLRLIFHLNLQYSQLYLPLPTRILGLRCNTYICIYLYQLNFGALLEYLHPYLLLPIGILGLCCNTYTHIYFYQLELWGFVTIPTLVFTFTNLNFGALLQYLHPYLLLPTGILGCCCNTYTCIYLYQLEFWGLIAIFTLVFTSTN